MVRLGAWGVSVGWLVVAYLPGGKRMVGEESGVFLGLVVYSK